MSVCVEYRPAVSRSRAKLWRGAALTLVLGLGLFLRVYKLDQPVLWCDEAESCINAMTILEHGVPVDSYLGLPIYENTLTDPWPESKEYEFRDSSYSKKSGMAIYHGWLPLYAIAGSFKLAGIKPDTDTSNLTPLHDEQGVRLRTVAARVPAALAGMLMLVVLFMAGNEMCGPAAGWTALVCASVAVPMVNIARQARYYSLTAALSAVCCLAAWRMYSRGRYRDFVVAGIAFVLMFHTHILTFAIASAALLTLLPAIIHKHEKPWKKLFLFGGIVAAFTLPWLIWTGFLGAAQSVPKAIYTMKFPDDLIAWPRRYWQISTLLITGMLWLIFLHLRPRLFSQRIRKPFTDHNVAFYFLSSWIIFGFLMFMLLIPAASLFFQRLYLGDVGPGIIFGAMLFVGFGRVVGGRTAVTLACIGFIAFAYLNTKAGYWWQRNKVGQVRLAYLVNDMRSWHMQPGTRVYATPNDHLTLAFYTGIPIQSIAPVRKSFLDSYPHDIVLIDCTVHVLPLEDESIRSAAMRFHTPLAETDVSSYTDLINRVAAGRKVAGKVKSVDPTRKDLPPFAESVIKWQLEASPIWTRQYDFEYINPSMFRGFNYDDYEKWWQIFFYRFVGPLDRIGPNLNFADRMKHGDARMLSTLWTVYTSPGPLPDALEKAEAR